MPKEPTVRRKGVFLHYIAAEKRKEKRMDKNKKFIVSAQLEFKPNSSKCTEMNLKYRKKSAFLFLQIVNYDLK